MFSMFLGVKCCISQAMNDECLVDVSATEVEISGNYYVLYYKFCELLCLNIQMRYYLMQNFGEFRRNLQTQIDKVVKQISFH